MPGVWEFARSREAALKGTFPLGHLEKRCLEIGVLCRDNSSEIVRHFCISYLGFRRSAGREHAQQDFNITTASML